MYIDSTPKPENLDKSLKDVSTEHCVMRIEINIAFLFTLVCKMFCQTNKKSCEDQNNHLFACELNSIFTNSFFTEILAIDKNLSEELGEKSVCRELISSPAPNLVSTLTQLLTFRQTMIKRP